MRPQLVGCELGFVLGFELRCTSIPEAWHSHLSCTCPRAKLPSLSWIFFFSFLLLVCAVPLGTKPCPRCQGNEGSETGWGREEEGTGTGLRLDGVQQPASAAAQRGEHPPHWLSGEGGHAWHWCGACQTYRSHRCVA